MTRVFNFSPGPATLPEPVLRQAAEEIASESERAAGILGGIRALARKRNRVREAHDPAALVREAGRLFAGMLPGAPELQVSAGGDGGGWRVWVDPLQIQQVLLNLFKNAWDAQRAGDCNAPIELHLGRAEAQLDWSLPRSHTLTAGGELLYERLYTQRLASGYGERVRGAVFVQDQWKIDKKLGLSLVPAVRFDADSQFGTNLAPKLALRLAPLRALTVRVGYGSGFRAPSFKELLLLFENTGAGYIVQGNPNLQPETSQSTNLGVEVTPTSWLVLSANAYRNELHNLIQALTAYAGGAAGPQRFTYGNVASAYTQGVELAVRLHAGDVAGRRGAEGSAPGGARQTRSRAGCVGPGTGYQASVRGDRLRGRRHERRAVQEVPDGRDCPLEERDRHREDHRRVGGQLFQ